MSEEGKIALIARMLVVAYSLGHIRKVVEIPTTVVTMMSKGHDGLNWEVFVPLAKDILDIINSNQEV